MKPIFIGGRWRMQFVLSGELHFLFFIERLTQPKNKKEVQSMYIITDAEGIIIATARTEEELVQKQLEAAEHK